MSTYLVCRCGRTMQVAPTFTDEDYQHLKTHIGESVTITDERIEVSAEGFSSPIVDAPTSTGKIR